MKEVWHIMYENENVSDIVVMDGKPVSITKFAPDTPKQPFFGELTDGKFYFFVKSRWFEDNYAALNEVLQLLGLKENNVYDAIHITHGRMCEDHKWIKFDEEELTWEDVKVLKLPTTTS